MGNEETPMVFFLDGLPDLIAWGSPPLTCSGMRPQGMQTLFLPTFSFVLDLLR
jgi:hypothetical protein